MRHPSDETNASQSRTLIQSAKQGNPLAQHDLHDRYCKRLLRLIRARIRNSLQSRFDAEDVVNSAFRSFFSGLSNDRLTVPPSGDLWPLLAQISIHKLHRRTKHHRRRRRDADIEESSNADLAVQPSRNDPDAAMIIGDELAWLQPKLSPHGTEIINRILDGWTHPQIAQQLGCSARTVRRSVCEARRLLQYRFDQLADKRISTANRLPERTLDRYLLRRCIGTGVFAKVYLALDKETGRDVAIKYLRKKWHANQRVRQLFARETNILSNIQVAGVVEGYGGGESPDGGQFLVMRYVDGSSMETQSKQPVPTETEVRSTFAPLLRILAQVHERGIIHCDIKPENVIVDRRQQLWLTDFGFACDQTDTRSTITGTPAYMAPEQTDPFFGPITPATDLYAVGIMMVEAFSPQTTSPRRLSLDPQKTRDYVRSRVGNSASVEMTELLEQLLQTRPGERLQSATQVFTRLVA
ncbi:MAG: protein kinase [Pirellulaceae bacterium]|nr:protein kinase [Pirellulaceae bacterium]